MPVVVKAIVFTAMVMLTVVSMWTTYVSLNDSVLPEPKVNIHFTDEFVWSCSVVALGLSVAIGLMLFAIKVAIIDEQKRLSLVGLVGLSIVAFISISFNMDVFYRTADKDFFLNYSAARIKGVYQDYLVETQKNLIERRDEVLKLVAKQEGELDAEIRGLRIAPEGYGPIARSEDYELTLLQKTTGVELSTIQEVMAQKQAADKLLASTKPATINEIEQLQQQLRVVLTDVAAAALVPLPEPVRLESPLFAVAAKLFDFRTVGFKEIIIFLLAFFLDLGDIIGYSLVPAKQKKPRTLALAAGPDFVGPDTSLPEHLRERRLPDPTEAQRPLELPDESGGASSGRTAAKQAAAVGGEAPARSPDAPRRSKGKHPFGFRR